MAAYCTTGDLLTGDIPTTAALTPEKAVQDAADEIDSKIGFRYSTPVDITPTGPTPRPVTLLLKRLNAHLASGRLIMAAAASGSQDNVHAYGASLVREASRTLNAIADGTLDLDGLEPLVPFTPKAPLIHNEDATSQVENFYNAVTSPLVFGLPSPFRPAGG